MLVSVGSSKRLSFGSVQFALSLLEVSASILATLFNTSTFITLSYLLCVCWFLLLRFFLVSHCLEHGAWHYLGQLALEIAWLLRLHQTTQSEFGSRCLYTQSKFSIWDLALRVVVFWTLCSLTLFVVKILLEAPFDLESDSAPLTSTGIQLLELGEEIFNF